MLDLAKLISYLEVKPMPLATLQENSMTRNHYFVLFSNLEKSGLVDVLKNHHLNESIIPIDDQEFLIEIPCADINPINNENKLQRQMQLIEILDELFAFEYIQGYYNILEYIEPAQQRPDPRDGTKFHESSLNLQDMSDSDDYTPISLRVYVNYPQNELGHISDEEAQLAEDSLMNIGSLCNDLDFQFTAASDREDAGKCRLILQGIILPNRTKIVDGNITQLVSNLYKCIIDIEGLDDFEIKYAVLP